MDRVEFNMKPTKPDLYFYCHWFALVLRVLLFWIYLAVIGAILLILSVCKVYPRPVLVSIVAFICLGFVLPIIFISYMKFKWFHEGEVTFFINEEGCGSKTDSFEIFIRWRGFDQLKETERYISLSGRVSYTIHKYLLPPETVASIKKIIAEAPVKSKKLLPDKQQSEQP